MIRVGVCCTFGVGSSMMLKMNLETAFRNLGKSVDVQVSDIANVAHGNFQLVFTSESLVDQVRSSLNDQVKVTPVVDYFDINELERLIKLAIEEE